MSESEAPAADWYTDPSGRFEYRYWDGTEWTGHVSTDGKTDWDPPGDAAAVGDGGQSDSDAGSADAGAHDDAAAAFAPAAQSGSGEQGALDQGALDQPVDGEEGLPQGQIGHGTSADDASAHEVDLPADHNLAANLRADVDDDVRAWLDEVAEQVAPRLSRISREWTSQPQAEAAKACAYGLLVGHLAKLHPHMKPELSSVAEVHESFSTLEAGNRLQTLTDIAGDSERTAAWLGPLIGVSDADEVAQLFD